MPKTIEIELTNSSINSAIKELRKYSEWVLLKEASLRSRLSELGANIASVQFSRAIYDGSNDISVRVDDTGSVAVIYAEGESVAFIEFGSGAERGYGHPLAGQLGFGPGTWSDGPQGKHHWNEKTKKGAYKGWWYEEGKHTYGNAPAMAMYDAVKEITENVTKIAREVFST